MHKLISDTVLEWSHRLDTAVSNWIENNETNISINDSNITYIEDNTTINDSNITYIEDNITIDDTNITHIEDNSTVVKSDRTSIPTHTRSVKKHTSIAQNNTVAGEVNKPVSTLEEEVQSIDRFFQNDKYLNDTENTYIRVRVESHLQSKESNDFDLTVNAQMPFSKSKKRFKIFVDDLTLDNANDILQDTSKEDDDVTPDIGIHYFGSRHEILSRYSIGLSGIDPFVKARYNMPITVNNWLIDPVQMFRYSTDDKFEEETNIYLDRKVNKNSFLRILLHRSTQDEIDGMDYALSVRYFRSTKKDTGFGFAQSFYGNTEYEYETEKGLPHPKRKKYGGIHNYVTTATWREHIWRKWFYYEIRPSVSFHKQYDYEPNYSIRVFFDFYFGRHHKI
ncbi:MAG: hypothetical protein KJO45_06260 [Sulfurovum sp.]|nr:hypothetical protein [Sulfurovum sp.]